MHRKIKLFLVFSTLLLTTMCRFYDQGGPVISTNGLSCQNYADYRFFEWRGEEYRYYIQEEGAGCSYMCPDGTVRQPDIPGKFSASSPLYSASKEDLDSQFCGIAPQPTPTEQAVTVTESPTPAASPTVQASPTATISPTAQPPLLTGGVTMCDLALNLINFRIVQPAPDLTDKTLTVQIADLESTCAVNPTNTSLLTCTIPASVTFPARVVVSLDGAVVNDFTYEGSGCELLDTPTPSPLVP
jgi:hypothetical protein